ncbi:MAG: hypothetical protein SWO11_23000 [Thermodesulfobacteriota bacterium]|jgi:hypothetical protein|nr:hypothetical protein [Thermodesulfobacteriota bacterium]
MTPQGIMDSITEKNLLLSSKNDELIELVKKKAEAKRNYRQARTIKITELRIDKTPVTLIPALAKGDKIVSDLCYKSDIAEGVYKACLEKISDLREQIGSLRSLLTWMRAEKGLG